MGLVLHAKFGVGVGTGTQKFKILSETWFFSSFSHTRYALSSPPLPFLLSFLPSYSIPLFNSLILKYTVG